MIGFGVTLPVLPFFTERLAVAEGASRESVALHVGMLTAVYALMQFLMAPMWGRWSDRIGRRTLMLTGIAGAMAAQLLFAVSISLWLLYLARIAGGVLSSALFPAAAAYVSDITEDSKRAKGMAWIGTSTSLGAIAGMILGGMSTRTDLHLNLTRVVKLTRSVRRASGFVLVGISDKCLASVRYRLQIPKPRTKVEFLCPRSTPTWNWRGLAELSLSRGFDVGSHLADVGPRSYQKNFRMILAWGSNTSGDKE
jgi:MFS family permease